MAGDVVTISAFGGTAPRRVAVAGVQCSWELSNVGTFSAFVRLDDLDLDQAGLRIGADEIAEAVRASDPAALDALKLARDRIESHHRRQLPHDDIYSDALGVQLGSRWTAVVDGVVGVAPLPPGSDCAAAGPVRTRTAARAGAVDTRRIRSVSHASCIATLITWRGLAHQAETRNHEEKTRSPPGGNSL